MNVSKWLSVAVAAVAAGTVSGEDLPLVYANDFTTRWSKWPIGGVSEYRYDTVGTEPLVDTYKSGFYSWNSNNTGDARALSDGLYPVWSALAPNDGSEIDVLWPVGVEGWRRRNVYAKGKYMIGPTYTYVDGGETGGGAVIATQFGSRLSNGTARVQIDILGARKWYSNLTYTGVSIRLGNDRFYSSLNVNADGQNWEHEAFGTFGICRVYNGDETSCQSYCWPLPAGASSVSLADMTEKHWYRVVLELDIDNWKFDYKIYDHGTSYNDNVQNEKEPAARFDGVDLLQADLPREKRILTTVVLQCWGIASGHDDVVTFKTLKIWAKPTGAAEEKLVYHNALSTQGPRIVDSATETQAKLIAGKTVGTSGQDGFRRVSGEGEMVLRGGDDGVCEFALHEPSATGCYYLMPSSDPNVQAALADPVGFATAAHEFGETFQSSPVKVSVDMRPPAKWGVPYVSGLNDQCFMRMTVGGPSLAGDTAAWKFANAFGISWMWDTQNSIYRSMFYLKKGAGDTDCVKGTAMVDTTHWYRFVAELDNRNETTVLKIYDLGTGKPQMNDETTEKMLVETLMAPFAATKRDMGGIAAFALSAARTVYSPFNDKYSPLFDNIRVWADKPGMVIVVR